MNSFISSSSRKLISGFIRIGSCPLLTLDDRGRYSSIGSGSCSFQNLETAHGLRKCLDDHCTVYCSFSSQQIADIKRWGDQGDFENIDCFLVRKGLECGSEERIPLRLKVTAKKLFYENNLEVWVEIAPCFFSNNTAIHLHQLFADWPIEISFWEIHFEVFIDGRLLFRSLGSIPNRLNCQVELEGRKTQAEVIEQDLDRLLSVLGQAAFKKIDLYGKLSSYTGIGLHLQPYGYYECSSYRDYEKIAFLLTVTTSNAPLQRYTCLSSVEHLRDGYQSSSTKRTPMFYFGPFPMNYFKGATWVTFSFYALANNWSKVTGCLSWSMKLSWLIPDEQLIRSTCNICLADIEPFACPGSRSQDSTILFGCCNGMVHSGCFRKWNSTWKLSNPANGTKAACPRCNTSFKKHLRYPASGGGNLKRLMSWKVKESLITERALIQVSHLCRYTVKRSSPSPSEEEEEDRAKRRKLATTNINDDFCDD